MISVSIIINKKRCFFKFNTEVPDYGAIVDEIFNSPDNKYEEILRCWYCHCDISHNECEPQKNEARYISKKTIKKAIDFW